MRQIITNSDSHNLHWPGETVGNGPVGGTITSGFAKENRERNTFTVTLSIYELIYNNIIIKNSYKICLSD